MLSIICFFSNVHAQRFPFTNISVKDGMPQSSVFRIVQDQQGYIWMATEAGVCRFDGYEFNTYSIHDGIGAKFISDMRFDPNHRLWVSTMGKGISWFDGKQFHRFDKQNGLPSNNIRSLEFSEEGDLFICTIDTGVVRLSKNKKPEFLTLPNGALLAKPWHIIRLKNGDMLVGSLDGMILFEKNKNYRSKILYSSGTIFLSLFEGLNGDLWGGGVNQIIQITKDSIINRSNIIEQPDGASVIVWDVFQPDTSITYFSTTSGLFSLENGKVNELTTKNGLPYNSVRDSYVDRYGNFWVGTYGGGAAILDSKGLDHFDVSEEGFPLSAFAFVDDGKGNIWIGTDPSGYFIYDGKSLRRHPNPILNQNIPWLTMARNPVNNEILIASLTGDLLKMQGDEMVWFWEDDRYSAKVFTNVFFLPDGTAMISSQTGVYRLRMNDKDPELVKELPEEYFRSCFSDKNGTLWFLADQGFIYTWKDGKVKNYTSLLNPELRRLQFGLYDKKHDLYWISSDDGLIVWNGKGRHVFNSTNGLHSDSPWSITQDTLGRIWVGHEKGVECLDVDHKTISFLGYDQGFTPVETNSGAMLTDGNGDIWVGTITTASRIRIKDLKPDSRTGILRVQKITAGNKLAYEEMYGDTAIPKITVNYNQNDLEINLAALSYSTAKDVKYSWFLENHDDKWRNNNDHRFAFYSNIPPGDYVFHAKATEPNGFETNEVLVKITIRRPFWNRPWFYITEFSLLALFIFFSFRFSSNPHQNKLGSFVTLLTILIIFESLLLYLSTYINKFTGDVPVFQLLMNVVLAATLNPLEHGIQKIMRNWALKRLRKKNKEVPPVKKN
jgi:ligand-binding sensor domain-containing protein